MRNEVGRLLTANVKQILDEVSTTISSHLCHLRPLLVYCGSYDFHQTKSTVVLLTMVSTRG